jgi:hypothetical protein
MSILNPNYMGAAPAPHHHALNPNYPLSNSSSALSTNLIVSALPSVRSDRGAASFNLITGTDCAAADSTDYYDYLHIDHDLQRESADHSLDQALPLLQTLGSISRTDQSRINDADPSRINDADRLRRESAAYLHHLDPKHAPIAVPSMEEITTLIPAHDRSLS